jgi:fatty-acid O-methyltransferase
VTSQREQRHEGLRGEFGRLLRHDGRGSFSVDGGRHSRIALQTEVSEHRGLLRLKALMICVAERRPGKAAIWFIASTTLTWSIRRIWVKSFAPVQSTAPHSCLCHTPPMALKERLFHHPIIWTLSQKTQKLFYPYATRRLGADDVVFLNRGYEEDPPMALPLEASDEPDRFYIQLYHRTATQADLSGKRVLEVGCGHGGGASYLVRTLRPASYTGLDLNPTGIAFCQKRHNLAGLDFVQGDAENLPFPDESFDAVINVDSAYHYRRYPRFLAEVVRVLRPGGHFLYVDGRLREQIGDWEAALAGAPMQMLSQSEINAEVVRGMDKLSQQWVDLIDRRVPAFLHGLARANWAVRGTQLYQEVQSGGFTYRMYCFAKA